MKILVINTGGLFIEGITKTMLDFYSVMDKNNIQIDLVATGNIDLDIVKKFQDIGCNVLNLSARKKKPIKYFIELISLVRKGKYSIVHAHGNSATLTIEMLAAKFGKCKVRIAHSRNTKCDQVKIDKLLRPLFYRTYTEAFACGKEAGEWLFGEKEFIVIHNGKNLEKFKYSNEIREEYRNKFGISDELCIGHVGNINFQKNHEFLIDIFAEVVRKNKKVKLFLMGDGRLRGEVEKKVKLLNLEDKVVMLGQCKYVPQVLQAMDIMVLPSRFEGLPNVVIEWQAAGLPCIISSNITKECAPSEIVQFMGIDNEPEEWANMIVEILDNQIDRVKASQEGINTLRKAGFDIEENTVRLRQLYCDLVNGVINLE